MKTSKDQKPPSHPFYGDSYERSLDPWHRDAFPTGMKDAAPEQGEQRAEGWMLTDAWQNPIAFIPDGTIYKTPTKPRRDLDDFSPERLAAQDGRRNG